MAQASDTTVLLPAFCRGPVILRALVLAQAVAIVLAFAPGAGNDPWLRLGLISVFVHWVALLTVALAVLTAFPLFGQFQTVLQRWLVESLIPDSIARQVLGYLTQFTSKASRLGTAGLVAVLLSAVFLMVTIYIIAHIKDMPSMPRASFAEVLRTGRGPLAALGL